MFACDCLLNKSICILIYILNSLNTKCSCCKYLYSSRHKIQQIFLRFIIENVADQELSQTFDMNEINKVKYNLKPFFVFFSLHNKWKWRKFSFFVKHKKNMFFFSWTAPFQMNVWEEKKSVYTVNESDSVSLSRFNFIRPFRTLLCWKEKINLYRLIYWSGKVIKNHCPH